MFSWHEVFHTIRAATETALWKLEQLCDSHCCPYAYLSGHRFSNVFFPLNVAKVAPDRAKYKCLTPPLPLAFAPTR